MLSEKKGNFYYLHVILLWHGILITSGMKNIIVLFAMLVSSLFAASQNNWQITLNKKIVLSATEANDSANTKKIKSTDWKAKGYLDVIYTEAQKTIYRPSLHFADEKGNDLLVKDSTRTAKIALSTLRKLFAGKKTIKIFLVLDPPNPMMAMASRMITLAILKLP
jgi:hypothetical protein